MAEMTKAKDMTTYDFREMEKRDEDQILAQLQGKVVEEMIYQFQSGSRTVTGISWMGIKEIARRYGKIDTQLIEFQDLGESVMFVVKAIDIEKGTGLLGTATQSKTMKRKDGSVEADPFAVTKALSKAQRNAIRSIIPEAYFKAVFAELSGKTPSKRKDVRAEQHTPTSITDLDELKKYLETTVVSDQFNLDDFLISEVNREFTVRSKKWIEYWGAVNDAVKGLGGKWVEDKEDKKRNHWRIPKTKEAVPPPSHEEAPQTGVSSIEELEEILGRRVIGMDELITVTQDIQGFTIDPNRTLDQEIVELISYIVDGLGGKHREHKTGIGFSWLVPYKQTE